MCFSTCFFLRLKPVVWCCKRFGWDRIDFYSSKLNISSFYAYF